MRRGHIDVTSDARCSVSEVPLEPLAARAASAHLVAICPPISVSPATVGGWEAASIVIRAGRHRVMGSSTQTSRVPFSKTST